METTLPAASSSSLHPVLWIAGISVTLLSLAGIAALTGFLPAKTAPAPERPAIVAAATEAAPLAAVAPAEPVAAAPVPAVAASKTVAVSHQKTAKRKVEEVPASPAPAPHPLAGGVPPDYVPPPVAASTSAVPPCLDCGVIANVRQVTNEGQGSGAGAVIGGLAGAALGSNIGRGNTRTLASIAGAVGGGLLGNSIEKSRRQTASYELTLRMDDGTTRMIVFDTMPSWRIGDQVQLVSGAIVSR